MTGAVLLGVAGALMLTVGTVRAAGNRPAALQLAAAAALLLAAVVSALAAGPAG